jgi:uncharacterized protein (UPF0335 family)
MDERWISEVVQATGFDEELVKRIVEERKRELARFRE